MRTEAWTQLRIDENGAAIARLEAERAAAASPLADLERWTIDTLLRRETSVEAPATFTEMMSLWVGNAAMRPVPSERCEAYAAFLDGVIGPNRYRDIVAGFARDRGELIEADLGPPHDFLLMEHFFRETASDRRPRFLEIGGGFGRLAEVFLCQMRRPFTYILCDAVPESVWYSYAYLRARLPEAKVVAVFDGAPIPDLDTVDVLVLPPWRVNELPPASVDVAANIASIQEMPDHTATAYFETVERLLRVGGLMFFQNSREFFYRREYLYPPTWRYLFKQRSPRSRSLDYPVDVLRVEETNQMEANLAVEHPYYRALGPQAVDAALELKAQLAAERTRFGEARGRLLASNERLIARLSEQKAAIERLRERTKTLRGSLKAARK